MRRKKSWVILLAVFLMLSSCLTGVGSSVKAANQNDVRYYYQQLSAESGQIYDAMYAMYRQGILKTGTQSYDLVENGHLTKEQLAAYEGKYDALLSAFGAARDAFYADYPDLFYVDFSNLAISVEGDGQGGYKAYLGTREDKSTYFVEGFTDSQQVEAAVNEHENRVNEIVQGAKSNAQSVREQVVYVHNAIIENTVYRLESNCSPGNGGHIRTSYGALVKGESLCEGYARAVKAVLDSMGITSVLVQGYYQETDGSRNLHMWNYVQIDGKWYGLDATADDGMANGAGSDAYLLVDSAVMGKHHIPDGVMSGAGFRFTYPQLAASDSEEGGSLGGDENPDTGSTDSEGYKVVFEQDGLLVKYREGTEFEEETGVFKVSYKGMGYQEAVDKEGVYILSRFYQYMPGTGEYLQGNWGYSDPAPFMMPQLKDALVLANSNSKFIEFAVTKVPPKGPLYGDGLSAEDIKNNWNFQGTADDFLVSTGQLENPRGNFVPSPFAKKLTPGSTGFLFMGKTYSITAVYNEQLEEYDGQKAGYKLTVKDGWSAAANSKIENFHWDGDRTITFDFTPSMMLADNYANYQFTITGLRGKGSLKEPDAFSYDVKKKISVCAYRPQGYFWNVAGKPELIEPNDLSYNGWQLSSGANLCDVVSNLVLVASKPELAVTTPDAGQNKEMIDKIEDLGNKVMASSTYNIDLLMCNTSVVKTGSSIRLSVGFPEGYGADTPGVVYKAYHFIKGPNGEIADVEEIGCVVTQYGLVIACKSFSPYAVVAVEDDDNAEVVKRVLFLNSAGGEVEGEKIIELRKAQPDQVVTVKAKEGYYLSSVNLSGQELPITDSRSMNIKLSYDDLVYDENIVDVKFTAQAPKQESQPQTASGTSVKSQTPQKTENGQKSTQEPAAKAPDNSSAATVPSGTQAPVQNEIPDTTKAGTEAGSAMTEPSTGKPDAEPKIEPEEDGMIVSDNEQLSGDMEKQECTETIQPVAAAGDQEMIKSVYASPRLIGDKAFGIILASIAGAGVISIAGIIIVKIRR